MGNHVNHSYFSACTQNGADPHIVFSPFNGLAALRRFAEVINDEALELEARELMEMEVVGVDAMNNSVAHEREREVRAFRRSPP